MKKIILILTFLTIIFLANAISALSCGETITENIVLTEDLTCSGNGIIVDADNVVIDGNGHVIEGDKTGIGIYVSENKNITIKNFTIKGFEWGIGFIDEGQNSEISNNIIEENDAGILIAVFGTRNKIYNNVLRSNQRGLAFTVASNGNEIYYNKFIYNSEFGAGMLQSNYNLFYDNKFVRNGMHVNDLGYGNSYDNGVLGNYWDDFESNAGFPNNYIVNQYSNDNLPYWFQAKCGDINADRKVSRLDISYLKSYVFENGEPPMPLWTGDVNSDGVFDVLDVVSLVNYIIRGKGSLSCSMDKNIYAF